MSQPQRIAFAIVTVSDTASAKTKEDLSGPAIHQLLIASKRFEADISSSVIIADESEEIKQTLLSLTDRVDVILTTGGTGFAPRDVTPEATKAVIERDCPGIVTALLMRSLQATPLAALSRLTAGIRGGTLIINLPGSPKAVKECFEVLEPILSHAVNLIKNHSQPVKSTHDALQKTGVTNH
uniref:molybdopterin molybdotransferase n=1 Tax=Plectus sambesii TaxID=2011161 RepID=A0A914V7V7_9BILA